MFVNTDRKNDRAALAKIGIHEYSYYYHQKEKKQMSQISSVVLDPTFLKQHLIPLIKKHIPSPSASGDCSIRDKHCFDTNYFYHELSRQLDKYTPLDSSFSPFIVMFNAREILKICFRKYMSYHFPDKNGRKNIINPRVIGVPSIESVVSATTYLGHGSNLIAPFISTVTGGCEDVTEKQLFDSKINNLQILPVGATSLPEQSASMYFRGHNDRMKPYAPQPTISSSSSFSSSNSSGSEKDGHHQNNNGCHPSHFTSFRKMYKSENRVNYERTSSHNYHANPLIVETNNPKLTEKIKNLFLS